MDDQVWTVDQDSQDLLEKKDSPDKQAELVSKEIQDFLVFQEDQA